MTPRDAYTIKAHELIGLPTIVQLAADKSLTGLKGTIRDEAKNILRIESDGRILTLPKRGTSLQVELPDGGKLLLQGDHIRFRPEDRVKRGLGRWQ